MEETSIVNIKIKKQEKQMFEGWPVLTPYGWRWMTIICLILLAGLAVS